MKLFISEEYFITSTSDIMEWLLSNKEELVASTQDYVFRFKQRGNQFNGFTRIIYFRELDNFIIACLKDILVEHFPHLSIEMVIITMEENREIILQEYRNEYKD